MTEGYDLFSWGANSRHQLSHGRESEQCAVPLAVNLNSSDLRGSEVEKIVGGAGHTLILTGRGEVWACGSDDRGQAGVAALPAGKKHVERFERLDSLAGKTIVDVACGWDGSAAVDDRGNLYVWGSNAYGQLGVGGRRYVREPTMVEVGAPIAGVAMGLRHSAIVARNGEIFVAGSGNRCQLGVIDSSNDPLSRSEKFVRVPRVGEIKATSCGQHHTLALDKRGYVYAWGDNKFGQVGLDAATSLRIQTPVKLENVNFGLEGEIFAGWTHNVALHDGKVYAWGRNTYGQLGRARDELGTANDRWVPKPITDVPRFAKLAVGSEHNVALAENGRIMSWGWNEHGNCGNGNCDEDVRIPEEVRLPEPENGAGILVGAGAGHSFALFRRNRLTSAR